MDNENEEVLEGEEEVEETEAGAEESEETKSEPEEGKKVERPTESLEDRKARLERQLKQTYKKLGIEPEKETRQPIKKTDGLDYAEKAYLKSSGIDSSEFDFVQRELKDSGFKDIDSLLENDYFKSKLEKKRALAKTDNAVPKGNRGNGVPTNSVDYWLQKPIDDVPKSMLREVVKAKREQAKEKGKFYNS